MTLEQKTKSSVSPKTSSKTIVIFGLQLMLLLAAIDQTIISTAMPKIVTQLGGFDRYAWATTSYLLTSTISIPIFGRLSDLFGRKRLLLLGALLFIVASCLCGAAGSLGSVMFIDPMNQFIVARSAQGLAGGIILGLSFSVVGDLFPAAERGKYQGHFAAVFALASIVGPTLGGFISDQLSWRWLFFMNLPIGLLAMFFFNLGFATDTKESKSDELDYGGIGLFICSFLPLLLGLSWVANRSIAAVATYTSLTIAVLFFMWFVKHELALTKPFIKVQLFQNSVLAISCLSVFITGVGMFGSIMLLPIFFQSVIGLTASKSGALLTPLIVTVAISSIAGGAWMSKSKKYKAICLVGLSLMTTGSFCLSTIKADSPIACTLSYMLLVGAGLGLLLPIYTVVIQNAVDESDIGVVTGFSQFFRSVGGTAGVAGFGTLMAYIYQQKIVSICQSQGIPDAIKEAMLNSPLEPNKLAAAIAPYLANGAAVEHYLEIVRSGLEHSIDTLFLSYAVLLTLTLLTTLALAELPLRDKLPNSSP